MIFKVKWYAAAYEGVEEVEAEDGDQAIAIVKKRVRGRMTLSMYADGYKVIGSEGAGEIS